MTKTNNQSAYCWEDRGQAKSPGLRVGNCSISNLKKLSIKVL